jgi:hypothetical protein
MGEGTMFDCKCDDCDGPSISSSECGEIIKEEPMSYVWIVSCGKTHHLSKYERILCMVAGYWEDISCYGYHRWAEGEVGSSHQGQMHGVEFVGLCPHEVFRNNFFGSIIYH